jgi:hypothetical protein
VRSVEFLVAATVPVLDILVDGVRLVERVRAVELPHARAERRERAEGLAPEPAPLLAGAHMPLPAVRGWPSRYLLAGRGGGRRGRAPRLHVRLRGVLGPAGRDHGHAPRS